MGRAMRIVAAVGVVIVLCMPGGAPSAAAATHEVEIEDFAFQPANLTISVGDTVQWTNSDLTTHTTTSTTGAWDSGALAKGQSFSHAFLAAGTYTYICTFHPQFMRGTITVSAGTPPTNTPVPTANPTPTSTPIPPQHTVDLPIIIK